MKKLPLSWTDIEKLTGNICREISLSDWRPDYVVGITRGGNVPATMISHYFNTRCEALKVSLRDTDTGSESNLWMAEDAFGYEKDPKNIIIIDDINRGGDAMEWIMKDWQASCLPNDSKWNRVWGNNVRFATLTDNMASEVLVPISYTCHEINKAEEDVWLVYPWENVGTYD